MSDGSSASETLAVRCCIAGGGPAGMMLGLLLARAGVDVIVLEKHADFFRDFRGDTIHPSTLEVVHELGLLEEFLKRPHQELRLLRGWIGDEMIQYLEKRGRDLEHFHGIGGWFLPIPATFVVGTDGLIKARFVDPDYRKRMDLDELLATLDKAR